MQLTSMAFDEGDCVFEFKRCLFEYKGREFMLYPGNDKTHRSIDTIVVGQDDDDLAFEQIHEFLYLFGWANQCYFHFLNSSAMSASKDLLLRRQQPLFQVPRRFWNITRFLLMSDPGASDDFKKAISLYNDAKYTNDIFYSFFCLYKILDLPVGGVTRNPEVWINANINTVIPKDKSKLSQFIQKQSNIGEYLRDECRNALAHIHRNNPGKSSILPFRASDYMRIVYGKSILLALCEWFIKNEIGIPPEKAINIILIDK